MQRQWGVLLVGVALATVTQMGCGTGGQSDKIVRVSRQNNSGTYTYFREHVLQDHDFKLGSIDQSGSKDVVELVSKTPNAIGYSGMGYATGEVKMLSVAKEAGSPAVAPTADHARTGRLSVGPPSVHLRDRRAHGRDQALSGLDPIVGGPGDCRQAGLRLGSRGRDDRQFTASGRHDQSGRLRHDGQSVQAWAEEYGKKYGTTVDVQVSGGGTGVGIAKLIDTTIEMANASREMKAEEKQKASATHEGQEVKEYTVALDCAGDLRAQGQSADFDHDAAIGGHLWGSGHD